MARFASCETVSEKEPGDADSEADARTFVSSDDVADLATAPPFTVRNFSAAVFRVASRDDNLSNAEFVSLSDVMRFLRGSTVAFRRVDRIESISALESTPEAIPEKLMVGIRPRYVPGTSVSRWAILCPIRSIGAENGGLRTLLICCAGSASCG